MPRLHQLNLKTLLTPTLKPKPTPRNVKPALPLHLEITEPTSSSLTETSTTPISPAYQFPAHFSNAYDASSSRPTPTRQAQTQTQQRPRSIVINISNLSTPSTPYDPDATDALFTKLLARTRSRRLGRRMSMSKMHIAPRNASVRRTRTEEVKRLKPRPNSFFGMGFEMEIEELEKIVEEVEGLSRRCREGEERGLDERQGDGEVQGEKVGYVQL